MIEHLADEHGVLLRRDMVAAGISDPVISKLRRREHVVRIRHGVYVLADRWRAADARGRHLMLAHGTWRLYGDDVALSHTSAALLAGAPSHGLDLGRAHLTHLGGAGERTQASVVHHRGRLLVDEVTRHRGRWVTAPVRTALDAASVASHDGAICALDWFIVNLLNRVVDLEEDKVNRITGVAFVDRNRRAIVVAEPDSPQARAFRHVAEGVLEGLGQAADGARPQPRIVIED